MGSLQRLTGVLSFLTFCTINLVVILFCARQTSPSAVFFVCRRGRLQITCKLLANLLQNFVPRSFLGDNNSL